MSFRDFYSHFRDAILALKILLLTGDTDILFFCVLSATLPTAAGVVQKNHFWRFLRAPVYGKSDTRGVLGREMR